MRRTLAEKGTGSGDRPSHNDTFSPSLTLGEYEIEEVSIGKAAKILEKSKRHPPKKAAVAVVSPGTRLKAGSIAGSNPPYRQVGGYEVEEIESQELATWMSEEGRDKQKGAED